MIEIWKPIPGYSRYQVSNLGRIKGPKRILKPFVMPKGYHRVNLYGEEENYPGALVHRIVLEVFVGPCPEGMEAAHGDGDPGHNALSNLSWKTPQENAADKIEHGTDCRNEQHYGVKLTNEQVLKIRSSTALQKVLAHEMGVSRSLISMIRSGLRRPYL